MEIEVPALVQSLIIYLLLAIAFLGWGKAAARVLGLTESLDGSWLLPVWLGFAATLLTLQLLHLVLPLTAQVVVPVFALGVIFAIRPIAMQIQHRSRPFVSTEFVLVCAILAIVAGWIALRAMLLRPNDYDSGLYHFTAIRWIFSHPIVPGLGNLHGRLAFNSSFFVLVAALNFQPYFGHGPFIANSFLLVLAIATMADLLRPLARRPSLLAGSHPFLFGAPLFALPPLGYIAMSPRLSSPSPDVTSTIIQIVLFVMLCDGVARWRAGDRHQDYRALLILVLAVTAVTIKLSNLAFSIGIAVFVIAYWTQNRLPRARSAVQIFLPAAVLGLVWTFRGFLLSGAPLYPSTIGYIPMEWAVPRAAIVEMAYWVYSWARSPGEHWSTVLGNWAWITPWMQNAAEDLIGVMVPLGQSALFGIAGAVAALGSKRSLVRRLEWAILAPPLIGLAYWFLSAPNIRFAHALFFLLSLASCLLFLLSVQPMAGKRAFPFVVCVVFLLGNSHFLQFSFDNKWTLKPCAPKGSWIACVPSASYQPIDEVPLTTRVTSSHLTVLSPVSGDQCWDAPLPCTPYFNPTLEWRDLGLLGSGFVVTER